MVSQIVTSPQWANGWKLSVVGADDAHQVGAQHGEAASADDVSPAVLQLGVDLFCGPL